MYRRIRQMESKKAIPDLGEKVNVYYVSPKVMNDRTNSNKIGRDVQRNVDHYDCDW